MKTRLSKISKSLKMRLIGISMVTGGLSILIYSLIYGSNMGFWSIYIGMMLVVMGLGFLGMNVGYPF